MILSPVGFSRLAVFGGEYFIGARHSDYDAAEALFCAASHKAGIQGLLDIDLRNRRERNGIQTQKSPARYESGPGLPSKRLTWRSASALAPVQVRLGSRKRRGMQRKLRRSGV